MEKELLQLHPSSYGKNRSGAGDILIITIIEFTVVFSLPFLNGLTTESIF